MAHQVELRTRDAIVDQVVYDLKRTRPTRVDLYKIASHTVDVETGQKTITESRLRINRAVVLPSQLETKFSFLDFVPTTSPVRGTFETLLADFGGGFGESTQVLVEGDAAPVEVLPPPSPR